MHPQRSTLSAALAAGLHCTLAILALALFGAGPAAARDLHWSLMEVDARLDAEGALHIVETQHMVFDGDWNGGERIFRIDAGQKIRDFSLARVDPESGERRELTRGDLDAVDHYDWADSRTVRWRSRLPSDPPFEERTLVYELSYRLTGVLLPVSEGVYHLAHDFAFTDREGPIDRFVLDLEIDPAFRELNALPAHLERRDLPPGRSVELSADLRYLPAGRPAEAIHPGASFSVKATLLLADLAAMLWMVARLYRGEVAVGRAPRKVAKPPEVDRAFIERELLPIAPEVVGALWDRKVRSAEVSALIARLVGEGKLESSVEPGPRGGKGDMRLKMVAPDQRFESGYERELVAKLFFGRRDEVTTAELKKHYAKQGFDPIGLIRSQLEKRVERDVPAARKKRPSPPKAPTLVLVLAAVACFVVEAVTRPAGVPGLLIPLAGIVPILYLVAIGIAIPTRSGIDNLAGATVGVLLPLALMMAGGSLFVLVPGLAGAIPASLFGVLALVLAMLAAARSATHLAMTREAPETIAARRKLHAARRYFETELARERPDLDDAWFPYVLAFGLSGALDRWSRSFGGDAARAGALAGAAASSHAGWSGGGTHGGWSGGGGQFGGAGASGAWATAATGLAAGVAPPSSSGSGGGGGGGGSSSGGGGGGGW